jgi:hypothetical protein
VSSLKGNDTGIGADVRSAPDEFTLLPGNSPCVSCCLWDEGPGQGRMGPFLRWLYGPLGLPAEYAGITEDISRTGFHARVVFGD